MLDRMVHVFSCGCVIPVVNYIRACHNKQDTDISLIRHFVSEVCIQTKDNNKKQNCYRIIRSITTFYNKDICIFPMFLICFWVGFALYTHTPIMLFAKLKTVSSACLFDLIWSSKTNSAAFLSVWRRWKYLVRFTWLVYDLTIKLWYNMVIMNFPQYDQIFRLILNKYTAFVMQVLDVIAPPYTQDFVNLFLPLIENDGITGTLRSDDGNDPVSEFICKCALKCI